MTEFIQPDRDTLQPALERLAPLIIAGGNGIEALRRLSGGASQELWSFTVNTTTGPVAAVLRRAPLGAPDRPTAAGMEAEAHLIRQAAQLGVPVPEVLYELQAGDGIGRGFVMRHVQGESLPRRILREPSYASLRLRLAGRCGEILARIHAIDPETIPGLRSAPASTRVDELRDQYEAQGQARPVFELALCWLEQQLPHLPSSLTVLHGDFRHGNLMVDPHDIRAVLDWELAHLGDPAEDLGWLCAPSWRFGQIHRRVGGFGDIDQLMEGYRRAGGEPISPQRLHFWQVAGTLFWGLSCVDFALEFRRGDRSVERAAIGRRASETEMDLLCLLDPHRSQR